MTDINEIIGRALCKARFLNGGVEDDGWDDCSPAMREQYVNEGAAVVKALGEAGYVIVDQNEINQQISDALREADERRD